MRACVIGLALSVALVLAAATCSLAVLPTNWEKDYGGPAYETATEIENTSDGGFIMVGSMTETDTTSQEVYLVKMNAHGDTIWSRHYGGPESQSGSCVVARPGGGYLAVGTTSDAVSGASDVYLLCVDENGDSLWAQTHGYASWDYAYGAAPAYEGGYVITGTADVYGTGTGDVFLMKVDENGGWENNVILGGPDTDWAQTIRQTSDSGYVVVGGTRSYGYGSEDVYLMKFNGARLLEWQQFYGGTGWDSGYDVREVPGGGFIVAGATPEGPGTSTAFLVRTNALGDSIWTGTYGGTGHDAAHSIVVTSDGSYVFAGVTNSSGYGSMDIYVQRVYSNGYAGPMQTYGTDQYEDGRSIQVTPDDGLIVAGRTYTNPMSTQAYAMRTLGYSPRIWGVFDVPNDQGGQLRLCWFRSAFDEFEIEIPISQYSVWRRIDPLPVTSGAADGGPVIFGGSSFPPGTWEYIESVPALGENEYCCIVPTLCDWTVMYGWCWSVFCVVAEPLSPGGQFYSPPDSGCSFDNLEPSVPEGLHMPGATELAWDEAPEDDFDHFTVYGSASGLLEDAVLISITHVPFMDLSGTAYDYYHVTASDFAGNESADASIENAFADVRDGLPTAFALRQNHPNPFTSGTTIGFDIPRHGHVAVEVIDVNGRVVRTLVDEQKPAGRYAAVWDALDAAGSSVGPGVYFVRMKAGDFSETRKLMLLR